MAKKLKDAVLSVRFDAASLKLIEKAAELDGISPSTWVRIAAMKAVRSKDHAHQTRFL